MASISDSLGTSPFALSLSKRPHSSVPFHTYILKLPDGRYYVGHTDNLDRRMDQHRRTRQGHLELLWAGEFESRYEALAFERRVKGWSRAKKQALILTDWNEIQRLAHTTELTRLTATPA